MYWIIVLIIDALLAFIPANIAKKKGYSFGLWWLFGFLLWIVALIVSLVMQDKNASQTPIYNSQPMQQNNTPAQNSLNAADELKKYKDLLDQGAITEEEYNKKKDQLLKLM